MVGLPLYNLTTIHGESNPVQMYVSWKQKEQICGLTTQLP